MHLENKITNTPDLANSSNPTAIPTDSETTPSAIDVEFWHNVQVDLVRLREILKNKDKEEIEDDLWFMRKNVWDEK